MRFQVPQFINIEDKIFGPFTIKQFVYLAGGAGMSFVIFRLLPIFIAIPLILPVMGFALALAFYKINKRPFIFIVQSFLMYSLRDKLYLWDKRAKPKQKEVVEKDVPQEMPKLSESKLRNLAWSLDVLDINETNEANEENK